MIQKSIFALSLINLVGFDVVAQSEEVDDLVLEEILVTSQKRSQNLQDVPISVSVVSGETLKELNMLSFEDLAQNVPSLNIIELADQTEIRMRGVTSQYNAGIEQAVGLFIDGIHMGRDRLFRSPFLDVERVEVLRGPQGTLYGKNTTAGALQIFTHRPTREFEASLAGTYTFASGHHNGGTNLEGVISGPLSETLSARFAGRWYQTDGYFENVFLDRDEAEQELTTLRLSLMWEPSADFTAVLKYERSDTETVGKPFRTLDALDAMSVVSGEANAIAIATFEAVQQTSLTFEEGDYIRATNEEFDDGITNNATLNIETTLGEHELNSITGYTEYSVDGRADRDFIPLDLISQVFDQDFEAFNQEFRLISPLSDTFEYVAGVFFQDTKISDVQLLNLRIDDLFGGAGFSGLPPVTLETKYRAKSQTWAAFAQGTWHATDRLDLILGLRYGYEKKSGFRSLISTHFGTNNPISAEADPFLFAVSQGIFDGLGFVVPHSLDADRSSSDFSPSIKLQYDLGEDTMVYASVATAIKSGGFDSQAGTPDLDAFEFDDENTISYELGTKGTYFDGRLRTSLSLFLMEITDEQASRFTGVTTVIGNIGKSQYHGLEFDFVALISESLELEGSLARLEGERKESIFDPRLEGDIGLPDWSANLKLSHVTDLSSSLQLRSYLQMEYVDSQVMSVLANGIAPSTTVLDMRVALANHDAGWELALLAENLTDEIIITAAGGIPGTIDGTGSNRWLREPRNISLQFKLNF